MFVLQLIINNKITKIMASVILKGKIIHVGSVEFVGEKKTAKQDIILFVPGYTDGFGDKKGIDENWKISIMGKDVQQGGMAPNRVGEKASMKVYLNSKLVPSKTGGEDMYIINAVLAEIQFID